MNVQKPTLLQAVEAVGFDGCADLKQHGSLHGFLKRHIHVGNVKRRKRARALSAGWWQWRLVCPRLHLTAGTEPSQPSGSAVFTHLDNTELLPGAAPN